MTKHCVWIKTLICMSILCLECSGEESFRIVITFLEAKDNIFDAPEFPDAAVVKQYSRRLILDLGRAFDIEVERQFFKSRMERVETVETDHLISVNQANVDNLVVSDAIEVIPINTTDPGIDGAYISVASQSPLWNLKDSEPYSIHVENVWKVTNSTPDVVVAVIDTGIAEVAKQQFLNLLDGYDFISEDWLSVDGDGRDPDATDPGDWADMCPVPSWHGTKVMSILASRHDNQWGMKGIAQNCSLLPVRAIGICKMGYATDVTDAIVWAVGGEITGIQKNPKPAQIVSLSLAGMGTCPSYMQSAINQATSLGAVVIVAAGNSNQNVSGYFPANCAGVIAVAASTRDGKLAGYSNWGSLISVSAPGGDVTNAIMALSVTPLETGLEISYGMGTSFATPHVAGAGALYASLLKTKMPWDYLDKKFVSSTIKINCTGTLCGAGIILTNNLINISFNINNTFVESFASWNASFLKAAAQQDDGWNKAGYIVNNNANLVSYPMFGSIPGDHYIRQCGLGQYICAIIVYILYDATIWTCWVDFLCCNNNNVPLFPFITFGGTRNYAYTFTYYGFFKAFKIELDKFAVNSYSDTNWLGLQDLGQYLTNSMCPSGQYVTGIYGKTGTGVDLGTVQCRPITIPCPAGYYATSTDAGATACPVGTYNPYTGQSTAGACQSCPPGTYNLYTGQTSCLACPTGQYNPNTGQTACSACGTCAANQYMSSCGGSTAGSCQPCTSCTTAGYYTAGCGFNTAGTCQLCSSLPYCTDVPGIGPQYRENCGGYSAGSCVSCRSCGSGNYWNSPCGGLSAGSCWLCRDCGTGNYLSGCGGSTAGTCTPCGACSAGYFRDNCGLGNAGSCKTCDRCPAGQYNNNCGGTNGGICFPCEGLYTNCPDGQYRLGCGGVSFGTCVNCDVCPVGQYRSGCGVYTTPGSCVNCGAGTYKSSATYTTSCTLCNAGTYSAALGAVSSATCVNCPAGTYSGVAGATLSSTCVSCSAGTYSLSGNSVCTNCPAGSYAATTGLSACATCSISSTGCLTGQYRPQCLAGATSSSVCTACTNKPVNSFYTGSSTVDGQSNCPYSCNAGFVTSGNYCCQTCNKGYFAAGCSATFSGTCQSCTNNS